MEPKDYIDEFKRITSNKFSSEQSGYLYIGLLFKLINDRTVFKRNIETDTFIKEVFNREYKDYLFRSRPYLASRLLSDLNNDLDYHNLVKSTKKIINYLLDISNKDNGPKEGKNKKVKIETDNIIGWLNIVKDRSDDNENH